MNKRTVWGMVGGVAGLLVIWAVVVAVSVGSEASHMNDVLNTQLHNHVQADALKDALKKEGYEVTSVGPPLLANGPKHLLLVYATWLTVKAEFAEDGRMRGFNLTRAE